MNTHEWWYLKINNSNTGDDISVDLFKSKYPNVPRDNLLFLAWIDPTDSDSIVGERVKAHYHRLKTSLVGRDRNITEAIENNLPEYCI